MLRVCSRQARLHTGLSKAMFTVSSAIEVEMEVQEAAKRAKQYVEDVFGEENPSHIGLEEIEFDESSDVWNVTVAFSRPWNTVKTALGTITGEPLPKRAYKIVSLRNADGRLIGIKRRGLLD